MSNPKNILQTAENYITKHNLNTTPEQLFIEFEALTKIHNEFEDYLKANSLNTQLEKMKRDQRLLEKRRLFVEWYFLKNQNKQSVKETLINLSEMSFTSVRTVQNHLSNETTA